MRHFIIGDVHGMFAELDAMLVKLAPQRDDVVVFVGDLVDKGPHPGAVVHYVKRLRRLCKVVLVEGNHEDKHRRYRAHAARQQETGKTNPMPDKDGRYSSLAAQLTDQAVEFLESAVLFHRIPEHDLLVVHGGVTPSLKSLPPDGTRMMDLTGKDKKHFGTLLRARYVDKDTGKMLALGKQTPGDPFWADVYDGRFGTVVFGHEPFMDGDALARFPHAIGVDLGAVFGGFLAALVVDEDGRQETVTVEASGKFSTAFGERD